MKIVGLIPARSGSKRIPDKNIKDFFGYPLIAYTIQVAKDSGVFDELYVSTDSGNYAEIARRYGVGAITTSASNVHKDTSTDIDWIKDLLSKVKHDDWDAIVILRPTNPFRSTKMLKNACLAFEVYKPDSIRAVQLCKEHPYKAWVITAQGMRPEQAHPRAVKNMHEKQYQSLPEVYIQNGSLEIVSMFTLEGDNLTGDNVLPYITENYEGFDINTPEDWILAEALVNKGWVKLQEVKREEGI